MGNRPVCGGAAAQHCVDECARLQLEFEGGSRDADEPECDPAGAVFDETLVGLALPDAEALYFAGTSNFSAVRWLISMGASAKARDRNGTTMLHAACRSGSSCIVQELIRCSLPLDAPDCAGWSPLHIAAVMGRREVSLLLLRARANPAAINKRGHTPLSVCTDPGTKEVLEEFAADASGGVRPARAGDNTSKTFLSDVWLISSTPAPSGLDDNVPTCEPFFVPRVPLFHDEAHKLEYLHLGSELFGLSAGHGLAFFVAAGVVHDHPTDLSTFLLRHQADAAKLGDFLGEDFSLAQTLRLAFVHSVDLTGTGVVGALMKAFQHICAPADLRKIDRLTSGIAHLWWRMHDLEEAGWGEEADNDVENDSMDWMLFIEDASGGHHGGVSRHANICEAVGMDLRRSLQSMEGLRRIMFSTVMLCWCVHGGPEVSLPAGVSPRRMSLVEWLEINQGIEADGSNIPTHVQKGVYQTLSETRAPQLLPKFGGGLPPPPPPLPGLDPDIHDSDESDSGMVLQPLDQAEIAALSARDRCMALRGRALIPHGGLERHESPGANLGAACANPRLAHCVLSENSRGYAATAAGCPADDEGEVVFLSVRFALALFLHASPSPDTPPYAFVRLQDAVLRDVSKVNRCLILAGRKRGRDEGAPAGPEDFFAGAGGGGYSDRQPFWDSSRLPLPICFLLADGRFQPFEALWLELQFDTDEELSLWASELGAACDGDGGGCSVGDTRPPVKPARPPPPPSVQPRPEAGPVPDERLGPQGPSPRSPSAEVSKWGKRLANPATSSQPPKPITRDSSGREDGAPPPAPRIATGASNGLVRYV